MMFFTISYLPRIINSDGNVENTPARISQQSGLIEVSKADFFKIYNSDEVSYIASRICSLLLKCKYGG